MHIPNIISLGRALSAPVVVWLIITGAPVAAFLVFLAAGVSDGVDGFLAKRFNWTSELGSLLDPLADKLLLVSIYVALGIKGDLPSWLVIGAVTRDLLIVLGVLLAWLLGKPFRVRPYAISRANTVAQIVLAAVVLADSAFALGLDQVRSVLIWLTAALVVTSLAAYLHAWLRHLAGYGGIAGQLPPDA